MISCKEATLLSLKKHEHDIAIKDRFSLWLHLFFCEFCRAFEKQTKWISSVAKNLSMSVSYTDSEKNVLKNALNDAQNTN